jgi:para-nitrobenzyl esterase
MTQPIVTTKHGALRGTVTEDKVAVFKGIPYAAPPFGANRFLPPRPVELWQGVRDALAYGPTMPKAPYAAPFDRLIPEVDIPGEDCLNLNIWSPDLGGRLPVMVWLHGGAFANGSGSVSAYDGTCFARDGVVCVTLNYRLGVDGFLHLGDGDHPANRGILDQIAALRWVQDNVAAFGGDPDRVTVFGQSAGAMSVGTLLAVPRAAGLFHRAILQSGAGHHTLMPASAALIGGNLADILGVAPTRQAIAAVPFDQLVGAQQRLRAAISAQPDPARWGEAALNLMPFEPVVDADILPAAPIERIAAGAGADVDILVGSNSDEFRFFLVPTGVLDAIDDNRLRAAVAGYGLDTDHALTVYRAALPDASPGELFAEIATDWFYRIPAIRLAEAHAGQQAAGTYLGGTYLYEFAWQPPAFDGRIGACHAAEIPFVFDNLHDTTGFAGLLGTEPPQQLADTMHAAWVSFATSGDPGWPAYEPKHRATMRFDTTSHVVTDPRPHERSLWEGRR